MGFSLQKGKYPIEAHSPTNFVIASVASLGLGKRLFEQ
jgi:hypothetical protein